jgi:hypothetical protein
MVVKFEDSELDATFTFANRFPSAKAFFDHCPVTT